MDSEPSWPQLRLLMCHSLKQLKVKPDVVSSPRLLSALEQSAPLCKSALALLNMAILFYLISWLQDSVGCR